ncbi:MAG TPA: DUF4174 domain-containing protein [Beijerinckiaceae bacterium]|jgi:hypothetical protein
MLSAAGLVPLLLAAAIGPAWADPLDAYRWRSRVLVVFAPSADHPSVKVQRDALEARGPAVTERDLVLLPALGEAAAPLRRRFKVEAGEFRAVLVGKDGGAKLSSARPIPAEELFGTIDAMPMRRDEMRRRP